VYWILHLNPFQVGETKKKKKKNGFSYISIELETKICKTSHRNKQTQVPLLVHDNLSPELLKVLFEIFYTFDKDKDGALCPKELDHFVFSTNGQHPPISFIEQMGQRFGANEQGWLTQEGFMVNVWPLKKICYYKLNTME
jgi:hypothetical protein